MGRSDRADTRRRTTYHDLQSRLTCANVNDLSFVHRSVCLELSIYSHLGMASKSLPVKMAAWLQLRHWNGHEARTAANKSA